jgi:hypothetical protein
MATLVAFVALIQCIDPIDAVFNENATCVPYDTTIGVTFKGVITDGTLIYVDGNRYHNLSQLEGSAAIGALGLNGITNVTCKQAWGTLVASSYFLPCDVDKWLNEGEAYPRLPCQSLCTSTKSVCLGTNNNLVNMLNFAQFSSAFTLTCSASNNVLPGLGLLDYPSISTTFGTSVANDLTCGSIHGLC